MECPYSLGCSRVYKKFSIGASGELEKGVLSALSAYYAPCKKNGTFPNQKFLDNIGAQGYSGNFLCFSRFKISEMENAPELVV